MKDYYIYLTSDGNTIFSNDFEVVHDLKEETLEKACQTLENRVDFESLSIDEYPIGTLWFEEEQLKGDDLMEVLTVISRDGGLITGISTYQGTDKQFKQMIKENILDFHKDDEDLIELIKATDHEMVESVYAKFVDEHELYLYEYLVFEHGELIIL